jgi:hypothetical protein
MKSPNFFGWKAGKERMKEKLRRRKRGTGAGKGEEGRKN